MFIARCKSMGHLVVAYLAAWWYGRPSRKLIVVGVTGTKGKSTTSRYIASVLEAGGFKVGLLSTVEFQIADRRVLNDRKMTMLGRGEIQRLLRAMVTAGCTYAVIETSSEGILQHRHTGIEYDIAVFTNLGTEHQERHGGYQNLRADKGKMFAAITKHTPKIIHGKRVQSAIIVNSDDKEADFFLRYSAAGHSAYGITTNPNQVTVPYIQALQVESYGAAASFKVGGTAYHLAQPGIFNVYNALAAVVVGTLQGISPAAIARGLSSVTNVPGRIEFIKEGQPFDVVVDYAHEPLSYQALFSTLRSLVQPKGGRVIALIGSDGGGRDVGKRQKMGQIAGQLCDLVIVTDVNCYDEDPYTIAQMLAAGARVAGKQDSRDLFIEVDRRKAIELGCSMARAGDVVAITAKGTEPVLCVKNGVKLPWDDREVAREVLHSLPR